MTSGGSVVAFVSPHGFGHAARVSAVLSRLVAVRPEVRLTVATTAPEWFFRDSLPGCRFEYRSLPVDVGLVQRDSLTADLGATLRALDGIIPPADALVDSAVAMLDEAQADAVLADIAPLGIVAGRAAGVPTVLVENFTWDWIYEPFVPTHADFGPVVKTLAELYGGVDIHIQTQPCCRPRPDAVQVGPIARASRTSPRETRARLGIPADVPMVLVSMGGVEWQYEIASALRSVPVHFVLIGQYESVGLPGNITVLPHRSGNHHPDLVAAADVLVGKLGYSTVAEAMAVACPFAYVERAGFAEYAVLADYVEARVPTQRVSDAAFRAGEFADAVLELLGAPRRAPVPAAGGQQVADILADVLAG